MTTRKRKRGEGSVETLPSGLRSIRIRLGDGRRPRLQGGYSDAEGEATRVGALAELQEAGLASEGGITLLHYGPRVLDARELAGGRSEYTERSSWRRHVATAPFAERPMADVTPAEVRRWVKALARKPSARLGAKPGTRLGRQALTTALVLLRAIYRAAIEDELLSVDPTAGVRLPKAAPRTDRPWEVLTLDEQQRLLAHLATVRWLMLHAAVSLFTGIRQSEQWHLRLEDVDTESDRPEIVVRYSVKGRATKSGKIRHVPLVGAALDAMREWLTLLPRYAPRNPAGLAFPRPDGARRGRGEVPAGWRPQLRAFGLGRRLRWHDLRHTCATSLLGGWWGPRWTLEQVRDFLGHHSVTITERYAHVLRLDLHEAARATGRLLNGPRMAHDPHEVTVLSGPDPSTTTGARALAIIASSRQSAHLTPPRDISGTYEPHGPFVGQVAAQLLQAVVAGDGAAALELAAQLLASLASEAPAVRAALDLQRALLEHDPRAVALAATLAAQLLAPAAARQAGGTGS